MDTVNTKMTALADEIRELSGTADKLGIDEMTTNVEEVNTEVSTQADLIAQIATAVDGLPEAEGGSMSTATVSITIEAPLVGGEIVYYITSDGLKSIPLESSGLGSSTSFTCIVPSLIHCEGCRLVVQKGNVVVTPVNTLIPNTGIAYYITGDCELLYW